MATLHLSALVLSTFGLLISHLKLAISALVFSLAAETTHRTQASIQMAEALELDFIYAS
ncbi:hypothetical protein DSUL_150057 [Desulfovibrionales bacterium]